jgi:hypothetical protein
VKHILYILTIAIVLTSCNRIKNKGKEVVTNAENKIKDKSERIIDKAFPGFDFDKADTKSNKLRFVEYLEVELSDDISNIYCFGDFLGADYKVLFSFNCDSLTIRRIIKKKGLTLTNEDNDTGLSFSDHFTWWDKEKIKRLKGYKAGKTYEYWQYLWYDKEQKKAYYEEYSL